VQTVSIKEAKAVFTILLVISHCNNLAFVIRD